MKKLLVMAVAAGVAISASAQLVTVDAVSRVALPEGVEVQQAVLSPDGNYAVVSSATTSGLKRLELATGNTVAVTDNGSILDLKISQDNNTVVFRQRTIDSNRLTKIGIRAVNVATQADVEVAKPSRAQGGFCLSDAGVVNAISGGKVKAKSLNGTKSTRETVVGIYRGHLMVTVDGKTTAIDPQGRGSYLWPTLSPDGKRIAYYKAQSGCYTCNLDGSDVRELGYLHAPQWLDNNIVVGMQDYDDGMFVTAGTIVAMAADGSKVEQKLTGDDVIAVFPTCSADGKKIAFTDMTGGMYVITLK